MKRLFIIFLFISPYFLKAQEQPDNLSYLSITTDVLQYSLLQPNLGLEFGKTNGASFGINVGIIVPDNMLAVNVLTDGQYKMPGTVYHGVAARLYSKLYKIENSNFYFSVQIPIKYEWFNNIQFTDLISSQQTYNYTKQTYNYNMNEKTWVTGIEAFNGYVFDAGSHVCFDIFYGIGIHIRLRTFNVVNSTDPYEGSYLAVGTYKGYIWYPTPVIGIKVGFDFTKKPQKNN